MNAPMALGEADASGRRRPTDTCEEVAEGVDLAITTVSQHPHKFAGFSVETDKKGRVVVRDNAFNVKREFHQIVLALENRTGWDKVERGFNDATAHAQVARCFKCNRVPEIANAVLPPDSWLDFNAEAVAGVFQLIEPSTAPMAQQPIHT
jgi:hypothetical protein